MDPATSTVLATVLGLGLGGATAWRSVVQRWKEVDGRRLVGEQAAAAHAAQQQQAMESMILRMDRMEA